MNPFPLSPFQTVEKHFHSPINYKNYNTGCIVLFVPHEIIQNWYLNILKINRCVNHLQINYFLDTLYIILQTNIKFTRYLQYSALTAVFIAVHCCSVCGGRGWNTISFGKRHLNKIFELNASFLIAAKDETSKFVF